MLFVETPQRAHTKENQSSRECELCRILQNSHLPVPLTTTSMFPKYTPNLKPKSPAMHDCVHYASSRHGCDVDHSSPNCRHRVDLYVSSSALSLSSFPGKEAQLTITASPHVLQPATLLLVLNYPPQILCAIANLPINSTPAHFRHARILRPVIA